MTQDKKLPLHEHLEELRSRLIKMVASVLLGTVICYFFSLQILEFLEVPIQKTLKGEPLRFFSLMEPFITHIKIAVYAGIFFSVPVLLYQVWMFVSPGLLEKERKYLFPFVLMGSLFFLFGAALCYIVVLPYGTEFFLNFDPTLRSTINIASYITFCIRLILAFGIVFQLPLILVLLSKIGFVTSVGLARKRKYAYVLIFVAGAILTPPDPFTQCLLALPLIAMYELSVLLTRVFGKKKRPAEE